MINVTAETDGRYSVWTDTEVKLKDGRCLAIEDTRVHALEEARIELVRDLAAVQLMLEPFVHTI